MADAALADRTVLITGAASGIGAATAIAAADAGARVGVLDLPDAEPVRVAAGLGHGPHVGVGVDVTDAAAITEAVQDVHARLGPISGVVTCAGIAPPGGIETCTPELLERVFAVNLYGTVHTVRAAIGDLRGRTDAAIVTIASVAAHRGSGLLGGSAYAASKSAVIGLTRSLARELGPDRVRANCIAPGPVDTALLAAASPAERQRFADATLLGRLGSAEEIAAAALFLLGPASAYITGAVLDAGGGIHLG